jgi:acetoin utilization deacetylase AcuC-like enzyme
MSIPVFFHSTQKEHRPTYEWAFGEKLDHPETTRRIENILAAIEREGLIFSIRPPEKISIKHIHRVHGRRLTELYRTAEREIEEGRTVYPSVFPRSGQRGGDPRKLAHAGTFCFDSGTPLTTITRAAAEWSAACAHSASLLVEKKRSPFAYALCRPPGHHASREAFGGYCYYNNAAIVAKRWREKSRVAIVDIDFHHGNGTQDLFYSDPRVLFLSIHGDPARYYPFHSGRAEERGSGHGRGFNINIPLPGGVDGQEYFRILDQQVLPTLRKFNPAYLILSAGFDTYREDPVGHFALDTPDFAAVAGRFASLGLPTVVLQEGGYCVAKLGLNVVTFLQAFADEVRASDGSLSK